MERFDDLWRPSPPPVQAFYPRCRIKTRPPEKHHVPLKEGLTPKGILTALSFLLDRPWRHYSIGQCWPFLSPLWGAHKWAKWLHNRCRVGVSQCGDKIRNGYITLPVSGPYVGQMAT